MIALACWTPSSSLSCLGDLGVHIVEQRHFVAFRAVASGGPISTVVQTDSPVLDKRQRRPTCADSAPSNVDRPGSPPQFAPRLDRSPNDMVGTSSAKVHAQRSANG